MSVLAEAVNASTVLPTIPTAISEPTYSVGYDLSCICRITVFTASIKPIIESVLGSDDNIETLHENALTEWLRMAQPTYIPNAAYYASLKSTDTTYLVSILGEEKLEWILEQLVLARYNCKETIMKEIALLLLDSQDYADEAKQFIANIIENESCEKIRSIAVLMIVVPAKR